LSAISRPSRQHRWCTCAIDAAAIGFGSMRSKSLRQPHAELFCQDLLDFGEAERLDLVLQPHQRLGIGPAGMMSGPRRKKLRELDVGRAELSTSARELARLGNALRLLVRLCGRSSFKPARSTMSRRPY